MQTLLRGKTAAAATASDNTVAAVSFASDANNPSSQQQQSPLLMQKSRSIRKTKPTYTVNRKTLDMQHAEHLDVMESIANQTRAVKQAMAEATRRLDELTSSSSSSSDVHEIVRLKDAISDHRIKLESLNAKADGLQYFTDTGGILFRYYDIIDSVDSTASAPMSGCGGGGGNAGGGKKPQQQQPSSHPTSKSKKNPPNSILQYFGGKSSSASASTTTVGGVGCVVGSGGVGSGGVGGVGGVGSGSGGVGGVDTNDHAAADDTASADQNSRNIIQTQKQQQQNHRQAGGSGDKELEDRQRGSLLDKYMEFTSSDHVKTSIIAEQQFACPKCGEVERTIMANDGYILCNRCHTVEYTIVDHDKPSYKDPPKEISYYAYKRLNHFNEWLNQVQGKETTDIPDEVFDGILLEIKKQKIENIALLTNRSIRTILKKLKINKYYEHIPHIINRLNGVPMPNLSPELEDKLRNMFKMIQAPFLKFSPMVRKNFLSYAYVLHKFIQLLGHDEYLVNFPLLKSREKLHQQDIIWSKICGELNWEFIKSL